MAFLSNKDVPRCSFCNHTLDDGRDFVPGPPGIYICERCAAIVDEELARKSSDVLPFFAAFFKTSKAPATSPFDKSDLASMIGEIPVSSC